MHFLNLKSLHWKTMFKYLLSYNIIDVMELYYVICICISEKNNGHSKRIIGEIERIKLEH